jgi:regulator of protease activity HflC (stomatin/prohibitin superfamily)
MAASAPSAPSAGRYSAGIGSVQNTGWDPNKPVGPYNVTAQYSTLLGIVALGLLIVGIALTLIPGSIVFGVLALFFGILVLIILLHATHQIQPYETGLVTVLGSYKGYLNPGFNVVNPIAQVTKVDLRTSVREIARQEVITKDNSPTNVDAIIYIKVVDAASAIFRVQDYGFATDKLAQTTLRSIIGDMELDEVLYNRERINLRLRDILDEATDKWGVRVEAVEIKEVDPVGPVKAAMEEQTSAERQRRAAVLRADGEKRSAILVAEGAKRSRILQAEGVRQSRILEAEGSRVATILEAQGESQRLRILSMGAASLDAKALTILSLDTATEMANGQATKILFPFEFTRILEGASEYLGVGRAVPERSINSMADLTRTIGNPEDVLGPIPRQEELMTEVQQIEEELKAESVDDDGDLAPSPPVRPTRSAGMPRAMPTVSPSTLAPPVPAPAPDASADSAVPPPPKAPTSAPSPASTPPKPAKPKPTASGGAGSSGTGSG